MSAESPTERIADAIEDDDLTPLGSKRAQEQDGAVYLPFPQPFARNEDVTQSTEVDVFRHDATGAIIHIP
jgi:hypothetical protein